MKTQIRITIVVGLVMAAGVASYLAKHKQAQVAETSAVNTPAQGPLVLNPDYHAGVAAVPAAPTPNAAPAAAPKAPGFFASLFKSKSSPSTVTPFEPAGDVPSAPNVDTVAGGAGVGAPAVKDSALTAAPAVPAVVEKPFEGCQRVVFDSKNETQKYAKNVVKLNHKLFEQKIKWESLCVRVDNVPVKFNLDKQKHEVTLSFVKGEKAKVSLSYCVGGAPCTQSCVVPHDEFMEALTGSEDADDDSRLGAGWGGGMRGTASLSKEEQELEKQISSLSGVLGEETRKGVNDAWVLNGAAEECEKRVAQR
ncbi:MAG: hypothetical protein JST16_14715 [Bdellovibrionales bacterium]|nr:hypothetical protein [Bdellovibrionales bacterium]